MNDLVSIVIPAYKAANYLGEAIESALAQTYPHKEIIVVNDGSPDGGATLEVAMRYKDRIRYYEKENGGCASALNYGMQVMEGRWFSWLSHDDLYLPEKLERLIGLIDRYHLDADRVVLGCNDFIQGESGKRTKNLFQNSIGVLSPAQAFDETLNVKTMNGCGLLIPKTILDAVGGFQTQYRHQLDRELWMRIAANGYSFCYADEPLVVSRVHNAQVTVQAQDSLFTEETALIEDYTGQLAAGTLPPEMGTALCCFAYKRKHYAQGKALLRALKREGRATLAFRARVCRYTVEGGIKSFIRPFYKKLIRH